MNDYDPRIVDLYDVDNAGVQDHAYYRSIASRIDARSILDIGCGTGRLTVSFAGLGRTIVGVDPSHAMIAYAQQRPGADQVTWIEGNVRAVMGRSFDLTVMTGNVAQHIPDPEWAHTLSGVRASANHNALLAFESRNPEARAWEPWHQPDPTERDTIHGPLREWYEAIEHGDGTVLLRAFNFFVATGEHVLQEELLTFRDRDAITDQLKDAGFDVTDVWGDWNQTPFAGHELIMVFEARAI